MNRIILGTTDHTRELNDYHGNTVTIADDTKALYISSLYKMNHIYFDITTPETSARSYKIELWDGSEFSEVADKIDETYGATQSGFLHWTPDPDEGWSRVDTDDMTAATDFDDIRIFGRYWTKITFTGITDGLEINWIGSLFSKDEDLEDEFYDLTTTGVKTALGVTDYMNKHVRASEIIINELQSRELIQDDSQLLLRTDYRPAAVQKVAAMIFNELGDAYIDQKEAAKKEFYARLKTVKPAIDLNGDGRADAGERSASQGKLIR